MNDLLASRIKQSVKDGKVLLQLCIDVVVLSDGLVVLFGCISTVMIF